MLELLVDGYKEEGGSFILRDVVVVYDGIEPEFIDNSLDRVDVEGTGEAALALSLSALSALYSCSLSVRRRIIAILFTSVPLDVKVGFVIGAEISGVAGLLSAWDTVPTGIGERELGVVLS